MCEYCEKSKSIFQKDIISESAWAWGYTNKKITLKQAEILSDTHAVFIDRGHMRFVDIEDCSCLDHGQKIKINFCPFCGEGVE